MMQAAMQSSVQSTNLSGQLDYRKLAQQRASLEARLPTDQLPRLASMVERMVGETSVRVDFSIDDDSVGGDSADGKAVDGKLLMEKLLMEKAGCACSSPHQLKWN